MTKKKATAPTVADGSFTEPILPAERSFKASEATQFLGLLGKDPAVTWLRCIKPGRAGASELCVWQGVCGLLIAAVKHITIQIGCFGFFVGFEERTSPQ
jgi:hypothetical protein